MEKLDMRALVTSLMLFSRDSDLEGLVYRVYALGHCAFSAVLRALA